VNCPSCGHPAATDPHGMNWCQSDLCGKVFKDPTPSAPQAAKPERDELVERMFFVQKEADENYHLYVKLPGIALEISDGYTYRHNADRHRNMLVDGLRRCLFESRKGDAR
jgi:hypothetical protein